MRKVFLHGALGKKYGKEFELEVLTAGEAIRALGANFPHFLKDIREGAWHVIRGDKKKGMSLGADDVTNFRLGKADLHIMPRLRGAKSGGGAFKVLIGAVLIGAAFFLTAGTAAGLASPIIGGGGFLGGITGSQVALFGAAIALAGVSTLLSPEEKKSDGNDNSFTTSGPGNTTEQGYPVPLVYGETITGGVLISGGIDVERIAAGGGASGGGGKK